MKESFRLDFVGVAAPRSGTTWISRCLGEHPQVCVSSVKEPHFFLYDSRYNQGLSYLTKQFKHYNNEKIKGEWSNLYLYSKEAALRIRKHNPDAKIIMCLRNPIERAYSQYLNRKYNASIMPLYSFKYIVDHEEKYHYLAYGLYAKHLRYYQSLFPKENIHVMLYEEMTRNPREEFKRLLAFLDVEDNFIPQSLNIVVNDRGKKKYHSLYLQALVNKLTLVYKQSRFKRLLEPLRIRQLLRWAENANKRHTRVPFKKPPMDPTIRQRLNNYFADEIRELEQVLDRDLDVWKKGETSERFRQCKDCGSAKETEFCEHCNRDTQTFIYIGVSETAGVPFDNVNLAEREKVGRKPHFTSLSGSFPSGNPKLTEGVDLFMSVNRRNDWYDKIVVDRKTGEIIKDQHEPLSQHRPKSKKGG